MMLGARHTQMNKTQIVYFRSIQAWKRRQTFEQRNIMKMKRDVAPKNRNSTKERTLILGMLAREGEMVFELWLEQWGPLGGK